VGGQEGGEGVEGEGEWVDDALRHTGNQVVHIVGQTDAHSSPDHTMRRVDIEWNSLGPQATLLIHPSGPQGLSWSSMVS